MKYRISLTLMSLTLVLEGCATFRTSTWIGVGAGSGVGAVSGAAIGSPESSIEGAAIGAVTGAVLGGLIGTLIGQEPNTPISTSKSSSDPKKPKLTDPEIRRIWQPDKIENGRYIEGHNLYLIEKEATWIME